MSFLNHTYYALKMLNHNHVSLILDGGTNNEEKYITSIYFTPEKLFYGGLIHVNNADSVSIVSKNLTIY